MSAEERSGSVPQVASVDVTTSAAIPTAATTIQGRTTPRTTVPKSRSNPVLGQGSSQVLQTNASIATNPLLLKQAPPYTIAEQTSSEPLTGSQLFVPQFPATSIPAAAIVSEPPTSPPLTTLFSPFPVLPNAFSKLEASTYTLPSTADSTLLSVQGTKPADSRPNKQPKNHVKSACQYCKGKHLKCEDARPCKRCVDEGRPHDCIDVPPKKRGRPPLETSGGNRRTGSLALSQIAAPSLGLVNPSHTLQSSSSYQSLAQQRPQTQYVGYSGLQQYALPYQPSVGYPIVSPGYTAVPSQSVLYAQHVPQQPQVLLTTDLRVIRINQAFQSALPLALHWQGHRLSQLVRPQDAHIAGQLQQIFTAERARLSPRRGNPPQTEDVLIRALQDSEIDRCTAYRPTQNQTLSFEDAQMSVFYSLPLQFSLGMAEVPFVVMTLLLQQQQSQQQQPNMVASHHSNLMHANPPHIITQSQYYRSPSSLYSQPAPLASIPQQYASYQPQVRSGISVTEPSPRSAPVRPVHPNLEFQTMPSSQLRMPRSASYRQDQPVAMAIPPASASVYSATESYASSMAPQISYQQQQQQQPQVYSQGSVPFNASLLPSPDRPLQAMPVPGRSPVTPQREMPSEVVLPPLRSVQPTHDPPLRTAEYDGGFGSTIVGVTRKRVDSSSSHSNEEEVGGSGDEERPRKRLRMGIRDITG